LARARGVEMPISATVEALLEGTIDARAAVVALLARPQKGEE
jgi:glycerol-3-phosphate dehydrogenase